MTTSDPSRSYCPLERRRCRSASVCRLVFLIGLSVVAAQCVPADLTPEHLEEMSQEPAVSTGKMQAYLDRMEALGFSGAAGVTRSGEVLLRRAMGHANLERAIPFDLQTGFFIASISKQFTAALILALEDRGLLSTEDHIGKYISDVPTEMSAVTLHHLLSHTSGLLRLDGASSETLENGEDVLSAGLRAGLEYEPGDRFDYSNAGYSFLAALAERVGGKSYETLSRQLLFKPAGMNSTSIVTERTFWDQRSLAVGYNGFLPQGNSLLTRPYGRDLIGQAGVVTTLEDMLHWELAFREGKVLSKTSMEKMFTPVLDRYAYGWGVWKSQRAGELIAAHDGHIMPEGFNSYYLRLLGSDAAVVVFAGRGDVALAERVAWGLVDILTGKEPPKLPEIGVSSVTPLPGLYTAESGARIVLHRIGDRYSLEPLNQAAANLFLDDTEVPTTTTRIVESWIAAGNDESKRILGATIAAAREQEDRFGRYAGHEVVYSVQEDGFLRTHLRHFVGSDTLYTRLDIINGEVVGGTDQGAFISGGRGLTPTLAYLGMSPLRETTWVVYDFWGRRQVEVSFDRGTLVIPGSEGIVRLQPDRSP